MTRLKKPVVRCTNKPLDGCFGPDRDKVLVVRLIPGNGKDVADLIELWPLKTRRVERIAVLDVYRYALRCRVNREVLEKAREQKWKKQQRRETRRLDAAERRLRQQIKGDQ